MRKGRLVVLAVCVVGIALGACAAEAEMPLPYGAGVTLYHQEQDYDLSGGVISLGGAVIPLGLLPGVAIESDVEEVNVKLDGWVAPFVNVFGLLGYIDGTTRVTAPGGVLPVPGLSTVALDIDYDGVVYGGGVTVVGGMHDFFGSVTTTYTLTDLDVADASITTLTVSPKVGYTIKDFGEDLALSFWVGAMLQEVEEDQAGSLVVPELGGVVVFDVELEEQDAWHGLAGVSLHVGEEWTFEVEGGFGSRTHLLFSGGYRF